MFILLKLCIYHQKLTFFFFKSLKNYLLIMLSNKYFIIKITFSKDFVAHSHVVFCIKKMEVLYLVDLVWRSDHFNDENEKHIFFILFNYLLGIIFRPIILFHKLVFKSMNFFWFRVIIEVPVHENFIFLL